MAIYCWAKAKALHFTDLFTALHSDAKIYQRKGGAPLHNIRYTPLKPEEASKYKTPPSDFSITEMVKETLYKVFEHPYVVINDNADIKEISGDVSLYMGLKQGQMNANLFKLAHDDLKIELRSLINKCIKENTEARGNIKKFQTSGRAYGVKITVRPCYMPKARMNITWWCLNLQKLKPVKRQSQLLMALMVTCRA